MIKNSILVVDLDGTLIYTDVFYEALLKVIFSNPFVIFKLFKLLLRGKAVLKDYVFSCAAISASNLPYNSKVLDFISNRRSEGDHIVLCTASNVRIAKSVADHLQLFDEVIASDFNFNVSGKNKRDVLVSKYGSGNFDYIGNAKVDLHVWPLCRNAYVVRPEYGVLNNAKNNSINLTVIDDDITLNPKKIIKLIRLHQWLKNTLIFLPVLTSLDYVYNDSTLLILFVAFFSFGFCASSVYVLNDLVDIDNDRNHLTKKFRPIASGHVSLPQALIIFLLLFSLAFCVASFLPGGFIKILTLYFLITLAYSFILKRVFLADCFILSILYTIRIISGAIVLNLNLTFWLILFSFTFFLSLAFVKRASELYVIRGTNNTPVKGRGYNSDDYVLLQIIGVASGSLSVFLFALYLNTSKVVETYANHEFSILAVPVLLFWVFWIWFSAQRGRMHDDPVIFAVKDWVSILCGLFFVFILSIARFWI